jgi:hypothetical protein
MTLCPKEGNISPQNVIKYGIREISQNNEMEVRRFLLSTTVYHEFCQVFYLDYLIYIQCVNTIIILILIL